MTLYRIPANEQSAKIAALAGAKVSKTKEHYDMGRGVYSNGHGSGKVNIWYCSEKWNPSIELIDYFDVDKDISHLVCDRDVSHLIECMPLEISKVFGSGISPIAGVVPILTLSTSDNFENVGGKLDLHNNVTAKGLRAIAAQCVLGAAWIELKGHTTFKEAFNYGSKPSSTREVFKVNGSSFIREIAYQPDYNGIKHTLSVRFLKADRETPRNGAIIYAIDDNTAFDLFKEHISHGGSAGQYYNSFIKGCFKVIENSTEVE